MAEIDRLRLRVARLEHRALPVALRSHEAEGELHDAIESLANELLYGDGAIDCPACGAPGDKAHEKGCAVTQ